MSDERQFQTTAAQMVKELLAHTLFVLETAVKERVDYLSDIRVTVTLMRLFR